MQARNRNMLAVALGAALLSPLAMAQNIHAGGAAGLQGNVTGNATSQAMQSMPRPTLPTHAAGQAQSVVPEAVERPAPEVTAEAGAKAKVKTSVDADATVEADDMDTDASTDDSVATGTEVEVDEDSASAGSQGAAHAAAPSKVARDAVFANLDANGDGVISSDEAAADSGFDATFATIDSDGDGNITDAEYKAFAKTQVPPAMPVTAQGAANAAANSSVVQRSTFAPLDADHDGRISATEAATDANFNGSFSAMDSDGDGFVTDAEFRAYAKANGTP